jgi:hypothetical protein
LLSGALPNPAIIGPPDPTGIAFIPPPPRRTTEEAIAEKVIEATVIKVGVVDFEPVIDEEVEEIIEKVVIKVVAIEAMVKIVVMDEVEPIDEVVI